MTIECSILTDEQIMEENDEEGKQYLFPSLINMKNRKFCFTEEINISPKYLVKQFLEDYGKDGEKLFTKSEELTRDKYYKGHYVRKLGIRLFCRDCLYYKTCKGIKWTNGCEYRKAFLEIIKKYNRRIDESSFRT